MKGGGKIEAEKNGHDDWINAVAGLVWLLRSQKPKIEWARVAPAAIAASQQYAMMRRAGGGGGRGCCGFD